MYVVFIACQVGDSGLGCCGPAFSVTCDVNNLFERHYFPVFVDAGNRTCVPPSEGVVDGDNLLFFLFFFLSSLPLPNFLGIFYESNTYRRD